jgi:hypothetical protein
MPNGRWPARPSSAGGFADGLQLDGEGNVLDFQKPKDEG